ncbi:MAG: O-antigen ligase family protein [Flavobacteriales bacterium]
MKLFDYFPFTETEIDRWHSRISSVTFEPPALGTYLLTISGWMFSYIITENGLKKYFPAISVVLLSLFSDSRSAIFIVFLQSFIFIIILIKEKRYNQIFIKIMTAITFIVLIIATIKGKEISEYVLAKTTSFGFKDNDHSISNKSRFGIQYTLFQIFLENPISGVGFGQQAFVSKNKYPKWATKNNWEFKLKYLNEDEPSFPPGYNIYFRIMAESGIIGFLIFIFLLFLILYLCVFYIYRKNNESLFFVVIFISMIGFFIQWVQTDSFRVFGFWINLALLIKLTQNTKFVNKQNTKNLKKNSQIEE